MIYVSRQNSVSLQKPLGYLILLAEANFGVKTGGRICVTGLLRSYVNKTPKKRAFWE
jgi:hypothetical protein